MRIFFFGSSLVSAHWNGAATYYRGLLRALAKLGHRITFLEPDAFGRQQHRDIPDPPWAEVVIYGSAPGSWQAPLESAAREADLIVKASGVGLFDRELETALPHVRRRGTAVAFWDVDAPATLERIERDPADHMRAAIPRYDAIFTYGGGPPVVAKYLRLGARQCVPVYNAVDPELHHPCAPDTRFRGDLSLLANRLPDREQRIGEFFLRPARQLKARRFVLGGAGWRQQEMPENVSVAGHIGTGDHNAFYCSALATLNVTRDSMARNGFSPPTRIFEAAGAGVCQITDAWEGIDHFLEPGREILVTRDGAEVGEILARLDPRTARAIGRAARRRVLAQHTYTVRAREVQALLEGIDIFREAAE